MKTSYALTFVSKDRSGIVADVAKVLLDNGFNIADSSSTLLQGVFSMILLVEHEHVYTEGELKSLFDSEKLSPSVYIMDTSVKRTDRYDGQYVVSVYGADKPGIVHSISSTLANMGINIVDLQTQTTGIPPKEVYIMVLELLVPPAAEENDWISAVKDKAIMIGTDITIRKLETYEL
ncbi:MAG: ACT domain-containing protein [Deferribacteraceae bacterium]|jgi:glycine cleavage system transcriptional repressor|nr:ACT domain-containing protein [Deferribacteraceae bacterium]